MFSILLFNNKANVMGTGRILGGTEAEPSNHNIILNLNI